MLGVLDEKNNNNEKKNPVRSLFYILAIANLKMEAFNRKIIVFLVIVLIDSRTKTLNL